MFVYLMSLKPGHFKNYSTPEDSFWCCVGTGMENHAKYGDTIFFHDDQSLYLNLFIASELTWREKHLVVRQDTQFPEKDLTHLTFACPQPVALALKVRWPAWALPAISIRVNGHNQKISGTPGSYVTINRTWHNGDRVDIHLPMTLHTEPLPGTTNIIAFLYGPIVLAGDLGTNNLPSQYNPDQTASAKLTDPAVPVFLAAPNNVLQHVHPTREPLVFRTRDLGQPDEVRLIPFYQASHIRYSVYWTLVDPVEWHKHNARADTLSALPANLN